MHPLRVKEGETCPIGLGKGENTPQGKGGGTCFGGANWVRFGLQ